MSRQRWTRWLVLPVFCLMLSGAGCAAEPVDGKEGAAPAVAEKAPAANPACLVKKGESIAFLGDSITQQGARKSSGYVRLVELGLKANGAEVTVIPAGISGHKSNQMLARLKNDVISKKPTWMTLSCGVNDVWHGARGVILEDYTKNITEIVTRAQAAGIKVVMLTSTMIGEDRDNDNNKKLDAYNEAVKKIAAEKKCLLVDLNQEMKDTLVPLRKLDATKTHLTTDGVHMAIPGNIMMAKGILKGFGFDEAMLKKADAHWEETVKHNTRIWVNLSLPETRALSEITAKQKKHLNEITTELLKKFIEENKE